MSESCHLIVNGRTIEAKVGETLVDAGLGGWIVIPHDCCSGQCDTCRVTVVGGAVDDAGTRDGRTVLACQATLTGDAEIAFDEVPAIATRSGVVSALTPLSREVIEVRVTLTRPLDYRPGQYVSLKFSGFPARDLSPTLPLTGTCRDDELVFHIRRLPGGLVSTQIGATIRVGHRVRARGPFGHAFLRDGTGPLILVAGGTGFAPIWSIAEAARRTQPRREMVVIAGARDMDSFYMHGALDWLSETGLHDVMGVVEHGAAWPVLSGRPNHYLPSLGPEDTVYVAGPQGLVDAVQTKSRAAGARCYADPFLPSTQRLSFTDRILQLIRAPGERTRPASAAAPPRMESREEPTRPSAPAVETGRARQRTHA